jgi:hypothetical protein
MAYVPTLAEFEQLFRVAPASLWLEDYSNLKKLFDHWRANGVTDCVRTLKPNRHG